MVCGDWNFPYLPQWSGQGLKGVQNCQEVQLSRKLCIESKFWGHFLLFNFLICLLGHIFSAFLSTIWSPGRFCRFWLWRDWGLAPTSARQYNSTDPLNAIWGKGYHTMVIYYYSGTVAVDPPPHYPQHGKKINTPTVISQNKSPPPSRKKHFGQK